MNKRISKTSKAGLIFPVPRIRRYLKKDMKKFRLARLAPVYLTAVMEYLCGIWFHYFASRVRPFNSKLDINIKIRLSHAGVQDIEQESRNLLSRVWQILGARTPWQLNNWYWRLKKLSMWWLFSRSTEIPLAPKILGWHLCLHFFSIWTVLPLGKNLESSFQEIIGGLDKKTINLFA